MVQMQMKMVVHIRRLTLLRMSGCTDATSSNTITINVTPVNDAANCESCSIFGTIVVKTTDSDGNRFWIYRS